MPLNSRMAPFLQPLVGTEKKQKAVASALLSLKEKGKAGVLMSWILGKGQGVLGGVQDGWKNWQITRW